MSLVIWFVPTVAFTEILVRNISLNGYLLNIGNIPKNLTWLSTALSGEKLLRRINDKFYSEEMLTDPVVLKRFENNDRGYVFI